MANPQNIKYPPQGFSKDKKRGGSRLLLRRVLYDYSTKVILLSNLSCYAVGKPRDSQIPALSPVAEQVTLPV